MRVQLAAWLCGLLVAGLTGFARAENLGLVVRDQSLGDGRGEVVAPGVDPSVAAGGEADYLITPNLGAQRGGNLFHSFSEFGVGRNEVALFTGVGAVDVTRILVRVTGLGEESVIDGKIRSSISNADFYLLNPNGISVVRAGKIDANDLPGKFYSFEKASVFLSTADSLDFGAEGSESPRAFRASNLQEPFSAAGCCDGPPTAFVFDGPPAGLGLEPATVSVATATAAGTGVDLGQTFAVVAGRVSVTAGQLVAYHGTVSLAAVGNASVRVPVDFSRADAGVDSTWWMGLGADAEVYVDSKVRTDDPSGKASVSAVGRIVLRGGALVLDHALLEADGAGAAKIDLAAAGSVDVKEGSYLAEHSSHPDAGGIRIEAGSVSVEKSIIMSEAGDIFVDASGDVVLSGSFLDPDDPDGYRTMMSKAGSISVNASGDVVFSGRPSEDGGTGIKSEAGDIFVDASGDVNLFGRSSISTSPEGVPVAGKIEITAASRILLQGGEEGLPEISARGDMLGGTGDGGNVTLHAPHIAILDGGAVTATTGGTGKAGNVTISGDTLRIAGRSADGRQPSAIYSETTKPSGGGRGGNVQITVRELVSLEDGGEISVQTKGSGDAGDVVLHVAGGSLQLRGGASVRAAAVKENGAAGDVSVDVAGDVVLVDSSFNTRCATCSGGNVSIDAGGKVELVRSGIETDVGEEGEGGDIGIGNGDVLPRFVLLDASRVTATAKVGVGGNIEIAATAYLESADSVVEASADKGIDGVVVVSAPEVQVEGRLDPLPASYLDVIALLSDHCAARRSAGASSFTVEGRPGLPPAPEDYLPSSLLRVRDAGTAGSPKRRDRAALLPLRAQLADFDPGCGSREPGLVLGG